MPAVQVVSGIQLVADLRRLGDARVETPVRAWSTSPAHQVIGLHLGGRYLKGNDAVALWKVADDPLLKKAKIDFV